MATVQGFVFDAYGTLNAFDVIGAKAFGFQVAWIKRGNAILDDPGWQPDITIQGLDELVHL